MSDPFVVRYADFSCTDLIDSDNVFHKAIRIKEAKEKASDVGLDLVCFNLPKQGKDALCKIIDYGKWKYHNDKAQKKQKTQTRKEVKEIQLSPVIDTNDLDHKVKRIIEFLQRGDDVIVVMKFRGIHKKLYSAGETLLNEVVEQCKEDGAEQTRKKSSNNISVRLVHN